MPVNTKIERKTFRPQAGPQTQFLQSNADITVYGGSAGGGKTYGTILYCAKHAAIKPVNGFNAVVFRREYPRITQAGGIWDESLNVYPYLNGRATTGKLRWDFNGKDNNGLPWSTSIRFHHLQHEKHKEAWKGAQVPLFCFDELTEFEEGQFTYLQSRSRSTCGVRPQVIATTNPDPDSWVKRFLAPWVDEKWPVEDRCISNETRYFLRDGNAIRWLPRGKKHKDAKSVKFIAASIYNNPILLEKNPEYLVQLKSLPLVDRLRLLNGDWTIRPEGGKLYRKDWFKVIETAPADLQKVARGWDFAATEELDDNKRGGPDWTATVKAGRLPNGQYVILDTQRMRATPANVERAVQNTASQDGRGTTIYAEQEPGSAGVKVISQYSRMLAGFDFHGIRSTGSKLERSKPVSSQAENGNILIVRTANTDDFLNELEAFPNPRIHDDWCDALSLVMGQLFDRGAGDLLHDLNSRMNVRAQQLEKAQATYW